MTQVTDSAARSAAVQPLGEVNGSIRDQRSLKRVAFFLSCDSFEGFYGGVFGLGREQFLSSYRNDFVWEYSEGLVRRGHEVIIYVLSYGPPEVREVETGLSVRFVPLPRWFKSADKFLYRIRNLPYIGWLRDHVAYSGYKTPFENAIEEDCIDVLYHQEVWTPRFDIVTRSSRVPVIGADHGAPYHGWTEETKRRSVGKAARVICQSRSGYERAVDFGAAAELMCNGVNTDFFVPPSQSEGRAKTVLAVGRMVEEQKRFSDLLHAMKALPDFNLTLVGTGPHSEALRRLADQLGISDRVTFPGFVKDRKELRRLYQECGVFVSTSRWEAVALVMLEAMSCCAPVVGTRIPSFEELITHGVDGVLVPVGAPGAVAEAIRTAYDRGTLLGANARQTVVERYSSEVVYARLSAVIEAV